nr:DUF368 domain-containing protein [Actinomyces haliotis]
MASRPPRHHRHGRCRPHDRRAHGRRRRAAPRRHEGPLPRDGARVPGRAAPHGPPLPRARRPAGRTASTVHRGPRPGRGDRGRGDLRARLARADERRAVDAGHRAGGERRRVRPRPPGPVRLLPPARPRPLRADAPGGRRARPRLPRPLRARRLLGLALVVKALQRLLARHEAVTLAAITGLMVGGARALWPWQADGELLAPGEDAGTVLALGTAGFALVAVLIVVDEVLRRREGHGEEPALHD